MHILRCMCSKFCVKFQRAPLKFHTKFWTHTPQNMHFTVFNFCVWVTISFNCDVISLSDTGLRLSSPATRLHYSDNSGLAESQGDGEMISSHTRPPLASPSLVSQDAGETREQLVGVINYEISIGQATHARQAYGRRRYAPDYWGGMLVN